MSVDITILQRRLKDKNGEWWRCSRQINWL